MKLSVRKRTGEVVPYESSKIRKAIEKAAVATSTSIDDQTLDMLVVRTLANAQDKFKQGEIDIEDIQDAVQITLMQTGFTKLANAYILYRQNHAERRKVELGDLVKNYLGDHDWRKKENATVTNSLGGLILYNSGTVIADYWLNYIYDREIADAHRNADMHIHDLSFLSGYCAGWSLKQLIKEGIKGVEGRIASAPAKHLHTLCNQMVNFLGIMQNEWAGAQAFSSFDTYLAPFVKADNLTYRETKQCIQSFIYGVNTPSRWGTQAPFSNITLDWVVPEDMKEQKAIIGGKETNFTYGDCKREMDMINKAFLEIMIEGDADGRGFQYPIPTYSITRDFDWSDTENNRLLFEMTAKYGTPYFSNYVNSDMEPSDVRSMCCRLRLDLRELRKKSGGYFGAGESTGSIGVVTINMPRLAYLSANEEEFYAKLDRMMDIAARSLKVKRDLCTKLLEYGLYPYTKAYLGSFTNHFSTIGLVGMNEACLNAKWIGASLAEENAQKWTAEVLVHMRNRLSDYQEEYGDLYNLEATPAESTSFRLAKHDLAKFPDIITANGSEDSPYYTNSSHLPVDYTEDMFAALDIQDELQTLYTSGTVFHAFLGEKMPSWESAAKLVRMIANNYRLPYYTISPVYSVCPEHGYIAGEHNKCPLCGQEAEVYARITGYYRPVKNWNKGKSAEYKKRKAYIAPEIDVLTCKPRVKKVQNVTEQTTLFPETDSLVIVTKKNCPKCKSLKAELDRRGIRYEELDGESEKNLAFVKDNNVMSAPTAFLNGKKYVGDKVLNAV